MTTSNQYPYSVTVPSTQFPGSTFYSWDEPIVWCITHVPKEDWRHWGGPGEFKFAREQDAVVFALRWS
jgi:hypothetical protein